MSMEKYFTRQKASEGKKVFLRDPGTDKETEDWLVIRNRWSDEFQEAKNAALQRAYRPSHDGEPEDFDTLDMLVPLVADWSFPQELTFENVKTFLREATKTADQIDRLARNDAFFFSETPTPSSNGADEK